MVNNIINVKNKPHAILLIESKLCDLNKFIKEYIKSIVAISPNDEWATKVENGNYYDVISLNGNERNIKKEDILNVINQFSKTSIEARGIKVYVIYGIEHTSSQAINSLLKFLEEPPKNTYAIFTTRSANLVLPTIKSRCQNYILKSHIKSFDQNLSSFQLTEEHKRVIRYVYYNYNDVIKDLKDQTFDNIYDMSKSLINGKNNIVVIKQLQEQFSKFNYRQIELFIKMLNALLPNNERLFGLLATISTNPIKTLLFNNIWNILQVNS